MFLKPSSNLSREIKNPTTFGGPWVLVGDLKSAPQNRHGPKAYGPGYGENFGGYKLRIHFSDGPYALELKKASLSSEKLSVMQSRFRRAASPSSGSV